MYKTADYTLVIDTITHSHGSV